MTMKRFRIVMSPEQLSRLLGVARRTAYEWIDEGLPIAPFSLPCTLIDAQGACHWIERHKPRYKDNVQKMRDHVNKQKDENNDPFAKHDDFYVLHW